MLRFVQLGFEENLNTIASPQMICILDFICMGSVELQQLRRQKKNTKWKSLAHSWIRIHDLKIHSQTLYRLGTSWIPKEKKEEI